LTLSILPIIHFSRGQHGLFLILSRHDIELRISFAEPVPIHKVLASTSPQIFHRLNEAHPKLSSGSLLGWRPWLGSGGVG
jgi:hypothetical protein